MTDKLSFQNVLDYLLDSKKEIPQSHLQYYSDLDPKSMRLFMDVWGKVPPKRKLLLLDTLLAYFDEDTLVSYHEIGRALLNDSDAEVRARALHLLAESDDPRLAETFAEILTNDFDLAPRMEAASLLGEFVMLGELDELDADLKQTVENALIHVVKSEDNPALRKRALESLGFSSNPQAEELIAAAFERVDPTWVASALCAMGRSHDDERWRDEVISKLLDGDARVRRAAVEAAGELMLQEAGPVIIELLEDEEEDDTVASAAIWTLSEIGGEDARVYLVNLIENTEDEETLEYLESALENLDFNDELNKFDLLDVDKDDLDESQ